MLFSKHVRDTTVEFLRDLMRIPSTRGNEGRAVRLAYERIMPYVDECNFVEIDDSTMDDPDYDFPLPIFPYKDRPQVEANNRGEKMGKKFDNNVTELDDEINNIDIEQWLHMYEKMLQIRLFEEEVDNLYRSAKMPGLAHLYIGEEAIAVGVCEALNKDDYITSTHRGHGHCLAKGASINLMLAELLGKAPGYCGGKGGSMHIADPETGNLGANAIVGGSFGISTGAAFSSKYLENGKISVCFFGEGALGEGLFYEAANMAALWKLPVIYVCEKNLYNQYTPSSLSLSGDLCARPRAFGIHTEEIDGQDIRIVYTTMMHLVERVRNGDGPAFLLCNTYRFRGHHVGDLDRAYRTKEEEMDWIKNKDPINLLEHWLTEQKGVNHTVFQSIEKNVSFEIGRGVEFALNAPFPALEEVTKNVYA